MQQDTVAAQGQTKPNNFNKERDHKSFSNSNKNSSLDIRDKISDKASDFVQSAKEMAGEALNKATDVLHNFEENASVYYDQGIKEAKKLEKRIETNIRENPTKTLLIAAGVGLVAWALWSRK